MKARKVIRLLIAVIMVLLLFAGGLIVFARFNPMRLAFVATFEVRNETTRDFQIVPIGMREGSGEYGPLPLYENQDLPLKSRDDIRFTIPAGDTIVVNYDYDDINYRHLLLKDGQGRLWIMDTDKRGTRHVCYGPQQSIYIIRDDQIMPAPQELAPCFDDNFVEYSAAADYK